MPKKFTHNEFVKKVNIVHNNFYDYSKTIYVNSSSKVEIICPLHGSFWQTANSHLQGFECKICAYKKLSKILSSNITDFIIKAKNIHGSKYNYSKVIYKNNKTKIIIICPIHGEFEQTPDRHLQGNGCLTNTVGR